MVSSISHRALIKATKKRQQQRRNVTNASREQSRETHLKTNYFVHLFRRRFKELYEETYDLREGRQRGQRKILSDKRRLSVVRWKLSLRSDNPAFWEEYIDYVLDAWEESKIRRIDNLIGFMENPNMMKDFYLKQKIAYRKDKPKRKVAGHSSKQGHERDWND